MIDFSLMDVYCSWVGAAIGAAGSLIGGSMSARGQSSANSANQQMSLQQMMFQERMARHAHRYEVEDLRKAGLNPILSGTGGMGAATPSGSTARMESVEGAGVASALEALTKITTALVTSKEADKVEAETEAVKAGIPLTNAKTASEREQPELLRAQAASQREQAATAKQTQANIAADTRLKIQGQHVQMSEINKNNQLTKLFAAQGLTEAQQAKLLSVNVDQATEVLKGLKLDGAINESDYGKFLRYIDRTLDTTGKAIDQGSSLFNPLKRKSSPGRDPRDYGRPGRSGWR